jgi:hypothetical protein
MTKTGVTLIGAVIILAGSAFQAPPAGAATSILWESTFNCAEWNQSMGLLAKIVNCDGMAGSGSWTTAQHPLGDQITAAANYAGGGGGLGFRHWRANGQNSNGGGLSVTLPTAVTEFWVRWYMRYQAGFAWNPSGAPQYTKEVYFIGNTATDFYLGFYQGGNTFQAWVRLPGYVYRAPWGWQSINGGLVGDGKFHCYEAHIKKDTNHQNGVLQMWFDGVQKLSLTNVDFNSTGSWQGFELGSNQYNPNNATDMYTDYDDIAVSTSGYIGPIGSTSTTMPNAPTNVRILKP